MMHVSALRVVHSEADSALKVLTLRTLQLEQALKTSRWPTQWICFSAESHSGSHPAALY